MSLQAFIVGAWAMPGVFTIVQALRGARRKKNHQGYKVVRRRFGAMALPAVAVTAFLAWPYIFYKCRPRLAVWLLCGYMAVGLLCAAAVAYIVATDAHARHSVSMTAEALGMSPAITQGLCMVMVLFTWPYHLVRVLL